jgi:lipopolysaccharide transport system ATP-binding protein
MSENAIVIENLSKRYLIGHRIASRDDFTTLRDIVGREVRNFARKAIDIGRGRQIVQGDEVEEFWALRDVSFKVKKGAVLGIIGRNGAGKSTLLKILSRITEPTEGRVLLHGRVSSLLEVGTGFHPELTGRENVFLNGAILGMTQREIRKKFDEIVAFADIEKFLDLPVKRYSSGMYVRLAFAVAAHLEPEILIVDEVLAVGDTEFQKKCLGKMNEASHDQGRTVLFVSHNMQAISTLCDQAAFLERGELVRVGPLDEVLKTYYARYREGEVFRITTPSLRWGGLQNRNFLEGLRNDQDIIFDMGFESGPEPIDNLYIDCELMDERERRVVHCKSRFVRGPISVPQNTRFVVRYSLRSPRLAPGRYYMLVWAASWAASRSRKRKVHCLVEHIDACSISAASPFLSNAILDGLNGSIVPDFSVELLPEFKNKYEPLCASRV